MAHHSPCAPAHPPPTRTAGDGDDNMELGAALEDMLVASGDSDGSGDMDDSGTDSDDEGDDDDDDDDLSGSSSDLEVGPVCALSSALCCVCW